MNYQFPIIKTIDDVLPALEGRDEFIVAPRDGFTVINYNVGFEDTFTIDVNDLMDNYGTMIPKGLMRRECRGLFFDADGKLISRPLDKFFNVGEREETLFYNIDMSRPHKIYTKLDGSMIRPVFINSSLRWCTKMGITDVGLQVEQYISKNLHYVDFANWAIDNQLTLIFEFTSLNNRIVISYDEDILTLLAVRENITGNYLPITS